ncbi:hypothetical protein [Parapedobacter sp. DT-150]|uniref:hypothetical protein n=1 Tax=Parapedobacter sp. DT-150 TaxID=3396162 RepID=UPI003F19DD76
MENIDYKELYNKALSNPSAVDQDTLSNLIARYPYAQPLRLLRARKQFQTHGEADDTALLYTGSPNWLYGFIAAAEHDRAEAMMPEIPPAEIETPDADDIEAQWEEVEELPDHPSSMDYLVPLSQATPHEKVSLYNDEHMPYSFLWWLNKARMDHAHTYQPYAPLNNKQPYVINSTPKADDGQLLDQQIRENIFHLQSPEEKLSIGDATNTNTISFQIPKKIDPIIERFIREEPQIKPPSVDKIDSENKARKSAEDQLTLVTETLAKIYAEQGLYPKAIAVYQKLSLKYPEKSAYFAAQIAELENKLI